MRGQGRIFRPKVQGRESQVWWLDYSLRGVRHRESSGTTSKRDAFELMRQRIGKRKDGTLAGRPERVTLADLKTALNKRYELKGNTSWARAGHAFARLEAYFSGNPRALDITKARVGDYQSARLKEGAARDTVRYEVAVLSAAFGAAVKNDLLAAKPMFEQVAAGEARDGFFEEGDFAAVLLGLPADLGDFVRFLRLTGWRSGEGEAKGLLWAHVDWDDAGYQERDREPIPGAKACIRLTGKKAKDMREFPFAESPELCTLLLDRWRKRDGLRVFHFQGAPIGDFRKRWQTACKKAGVEGRILHDLRRTAARDFRQAGVSEGEIMKLCGWKTRAMFDRYNVIDSTDLSRAVAKRFNGKQTANNPVEAERVS